MRLLSIILVFISINFALFSQGETCNEAMEITINNTYTADGPATGNGCFTCAGTATNADWYQFTPTADASISISSCISGQDTHFYVYTGDCGTLTEVASNDDNGCGVGTNFASYAELNIIAGTTYYIEWTDQWANGSFDFVIEEIVCPAPSNLSFSNITDQSVEIDWTSANIGTDFALEYGEFGFTQGTGTIITGVLGTDGPSVLIEGLTPATSYECYLTENCAGGAVTTQSINFETFVELASNDLCENAIELTCGLSITSSNINATLDTNAPQCGQVEVDANGIWYHFTGEESFITITTCAPVGFDSRLSVYTSGDSCNDLVCVVANDDDIDCTNFSSTVHFTGQTGVDYYVLVHGFEGSTGEFTINLTCEELCSPVPSNGMCANATPIDISADCEMIPATNQCASFNLMNPECSPFQETQDVWYTFNSGDSESVGITANTIDASELGFSVYSDCGGESIICIESYDVFTAFSVEPNTDYYIQFWSQYDDAGSFEFCLTDNVCSGASDVSASVSDTDVVISWTSANPDQAFIVEYGEAGFIQGNGFTVTGVSGTDGPPVTIPGLMDDTQYEYYITEACEFGEFISGPHTFTIGSVPPINDECVNATDIPDCIFTIDGTTINASVAQVPECSSVASTAPGVWYHIPQAFDLLTYSASTCDNASFDTKISVFTGSCDNLVCLDANDNSAACINTSSSQIIYNTSEPEVWILVHGNASETGDFTLTMDCTDGINEIANSQELVISPNPTSGSIRIAFDNSKFNSDITVKIFNTLGQEVYSQSKINPMNGLIDNIDLNLLSSGQYFIALGDNKNTVHAKITIE